ncbi:MAG: selenium-dependent molybdenum cofactor biosynthesis protein YqeB [Anaerolineae bacterium]|nr:selenium-dependent molybdenum cofactor biosynthesis protein YqeB [Anaerolineae bacterium]
MAAPITTDRAPVVIVKGAGDLGTGVAYRLHRAGFRVLCTDLPTPLVIRRTVAFASAVFEREIVVEEVRAELIADVRESSAAWQRSSVPIMVDPACQCRHALQPVAVVDCILAKRNTGTAIDDAPVVVACGPGFTVGQDCHAIVETMRGHNLGRVIRRGAAQPNTGLPGEIGGHGALRVVRAPCDGRFLGVRTIGDQVQAGEILAQVANAQGATQPVLATINGVLRGIIHDDSVVTAGLKVADIDPRAEVSHCFSISDKALAIGGGVLEAILSLRAM